MLSRVRSHQGAPFDREITMMIRIFELSQKHDSENSEKCSPFAAWPFNSADEQ